MDLKSDLEQLERALNALQHHLALGATTVSQANQSWGSLPSFDFQFDDIDIDTLDAVILDMP